MFFIKIKNTDITVCVSKSTNNTYEATSCDSEGHEGLLCDGITTLKELSDVLAKYFG